MFCYVRILCLGPSWASARAGSSICKVRPARRCAGMESPTLSRRHNKLTIDPDRAERRQSAQGLFNAKTRASFTPEQVAECRELFQIFDKNGDDKIDKSEFVPMMKALGLNLTSQELDMFFTRMDYNGDGSVQFHELVRFLEGISQPITLEQEI